MERRVNGSMVLHAIFGICFGSRVGCLTRETGQWGYEVYLYGYLYYTTVNTDFIVGQTSSFRAAPGLGASYG
jgi:hypothetical protein